MQTTINQDILLQQFNILPENLKFQVLDYIDFLINRYAVSNRTKAKEKVEEISEELKALLDERVAAYEQNPQNVVTWEELKEKFNKKYNYAI